VHHPQSLDDRSLEDIDEILSEYPYFQSARLLKIKNLSNQGSMGYDRELKRVAIWVTDRSKLFHLLDHRVLLPIDEYKESVQHDSTIENQPLTIDFSALTEVTAFDSISEKRSSQDDMNDELSQLIMSGSAHASTFFNVDDKVDLQDFVKTFKKQKYTETSGSDKTENNEDRRKKLIDTFIIDQPRIVQKENIQTASGTFQQIPLKEDAEMITDTLAKIYINQGKYEKAILAYEKLSLKYPEKNIYFAGQIKKIKELINNQ
jgi:hypothetical protein